MSPAATIGLSSRSGRRWASMRLPSAQGRPTAATTIVRRPWKGVPVATSATRAATVRNSRRAANLQSQRGVRGGYTFARPPADVTVLEVVELLEGELGADSPQAGPIWDEAVEAVKGVLSGATIAELAEREARAAGAAMYYI